MFCRRRCSAWALTSLWQATRAIQASVQAREVIPTPLLRRRGVIEDFFPIGDTVVNAPVQLAAQVGFASLGFAPYGGTITVSDITTGTPVVLGKGKVDSAKYGGYWTATCQSSHTWNAHAQVGLYRRQQRERRVTDLLRAIHRYRLFQCELEYRRHKLIRRTTCYPDRDGRFKYPVAHCHWHRYLLQRYDRHWRGQSPEERDGRLCHPQASCRRQQLDGKLFGRCYPYCFGVVSCRRRRSRTTSCSCYLRAVTVTQGHSESVTVDLIPQGGFANPVQLACSNLPADVTCRFSKSTINLDGINPVTVALTLKAGAAAAVSRTAVVITATSLAGTTPKKATLELTIEK